MKLYEYSATTRDGRKVSGRQSAASKNEAVRLLRNKNDLRPIRVKEVQPVALKGKVSDHTLSMTIDSLADMIDGGIPLHEAVETLSQSMKGQPLGQVFSVMRDDLGAGYPLSEAMSRHPKVFSRLAIGLANAGEESGRLPESMSSYAEMLAFGVEMKAQTKKALTYPITVIVIMIAAVLVINWFVIPSMAQIYDQFDSELPFITRMMIGFSEFLTNSAPAIVGGMVVGGMLFARWIRTDLGRLAFDNFMLRAPLVGSLVHRASLSRFCQALGGAMASGLPVDKAIGVSLDATGNVAAEARLRKALPIISSGHAFADGMRASDLFSPLAMMMIVTGEKNGTVDAAISKISKRYKKEVEYELQALPGKLTPIITIALGALVTLLAIAIFVPMWDLGAVAMGK